MPHMSFDVSNEIAKELQRRADRSNQTCSQYLAGVIRSAVADRWPDAYFDQVVGGWRGQPLERPEQPPAEDGEGPR